MRHILSVFLLAVGVVAGWLLHSLHTDSDDATETTNKEPLYWVAPMDANYRRDKPGKSPMGMDLIPVYEEAADSNVIISPSVEQNLGIKTAQVLQAPLQQSINTVGYVVFDEEKLAHIHVRAEGWIDKLAVTSVGDPVKKDQVLFEFYSPQLVFAQEEYVAALAGNNRELQRGARTKLRALGISDRQIEELAKTRRVKNIIYRADRDGFVSSLNVREGAYANPEKEVMAVGQIETVWVIAEIFQQQADAIKQQQSVVMTVDGYPGRQWLGSVEYIYPSLDASLRTIQIRIRFDNQDLALKPNMYVDLDFSSTHNHPVLQIPKQAVIYTEASTRVVKQVEPGVYQSVSIVIGREAQDHVEVIEGLSEGEAVVTSAQFLLDSESNINSALARFEANTSFSDMDHSKMDHSGMNHSDMDRSEMDHSEMDHSDMDHSTMSHDDH